MLSGTTLEVRVSALTFLAPPAPLPQPFLLGCWKLLADDEGVCKCQRDPRSIRAVGNK